MEEYGCYNAQHIVIREVTDPYGLEPWEFERYVCIWLDGEKAVDTQEILAVLEKANEKEMRAYAIEDTRHHYNWGASGDTQFLGVTVQAVVAGGAGGVASAITVKLLDVLQQRLTNRKRRFTLEEAMQMSQSLLQDDCKVPGKLEFIKANAGKGEHTTEWFAVDTGFTYSVMIARNGSLKQVQRLSNENSP